jgi:hypothetical protein
LKKKNTSMTTEVKITTEVEVEVKPITEVKVALTLILTQRALGVESFSPRAKRARSVPALVR